MFFATRTNLLLRPVFVGHESGLFSGESLYFVGLFSCKVLSYPHQIYRSLECKNKTTFWLDENWSSRWDGHNNAVILVTANL